MLFEQRGDGGGDVVVGDAQGGGGRDDPDWRVRVGELGGEAGDDFPGGIGLDV